MGAAIPLRADDDAATLRRLAKVSANGNQTRRLLALAEIDDDGSRSDGARIGGVGLQVIRLSRQARRACGRSASGPRQRVLRFNAAGPDGLIDRSAPGQRPKLNETQRAALARMVEDGPIPAVHGVVGWRLKDLALWIFEAFAIALDETTVGRMLRAMGLRKLSARPRHDAQNELALDDFKKHSRPNWRRSARHSRSAPKERSGGTMKPG